MTSTTVRVALRVKPLYTNEKNNLNEMTECISFVKNEPRINIGNDNRSFTFDFVYPPMSTQKEIYNSSIIPLIDRFIEGKNVTILAYGQTGSGKTYSMGTGLEAICSNPDKQGIIPRFTETIFNRMTQIKDESPSNDFQIYVSYIELYNEDINDLLLTSESNISGQDNNPPTIREDTEGNIVWSGINEKRVYTKNDILRLLQKGSQRRTTGSTKMNMSSSRSHAIFSILLKQQIMENNDIQTNNHLLNDENSIIPERLVSFNSKHLVSKFHFVDLAGSERLKRTNAIGDRQKEGIFINGGLLALGNVISALSDESNSKRGSQHVPYRDSKLTRLLQDSLGGNSHTLMLACISSSSSDYMETLNTLKYASRACHIHNKVRINLDHQLPDGYLSQEESHFLRNQVSRLKNEVLLLRDIHGSKHHPFMDELKSMREEINHMKTYYNSVGSTLQQQQQQQTYQNKEEKKHSHNMSQQNTTHSLLQHYAQEVEDLRSQVAETHAKLNTLYKTAAKSGITANKLHLKLIGRDHYFSLPPKTLSSVGYFDKKNKKPLFGGSQRYHHQKSSLSHSRLKSNKRRPTFQRMKTQSLPSSKRKNCKSNEKMDELLEILRKEYQEGGNTYDMINEQSTDETVLLASHADLTIEKAIVDESKANLEVLPDNQIKKNTHISTMPSNSVVYPYNYILEDDELEALAVPSWSDAPKIQSIHDSSKRKSISLDSMWDDTESSITTSRIESFNEDKSNIEDGYELYKQTTLNNSSSRSKDIRRLQNRNMLKMLHQIQADVLVKRELVGELEKTEGRYTQMCNSYAEKLSELNEHLLEIQKQQQEDITVPSIPKKITTVKKGATLRRANTITSSPSITRPQSALQLRENREAQEVRSQYEVKMKLLVAENQELRKKNLQSTQAVKIARTKAEELISRLRADIEVLKLDKKKLNKERKQEVDKGREAAIKYEREIQQLKRRVLVAFDSKKKLEEENHTQAQLIKKRTDETATANMQLRCLTNVLRKAANEGTFLNEASLEKLLENANSIMQQTARNNNNRKSVIIRTGTISPIGDSSSVNSNNSSI